MEQEKLQFVIMRVSELLEEEVEDPDELAHRIVGHIRAASVEADWRANVIEMMESSDFRTNEEDV